ncbi:glycosyltransferase [Roseovarius sp. 217]|uniref:glycosyltransferase n=1 Tax=Roseovarius sp. (strain 217) TaxID=314264 RepID=UPI0000684D5F|nr:glycosyltransferase [Roseovarius sp. 217]EAQ25602.1 related to glycosyltransferase (PssE) [Roseovarius sp. 217]
MIFLTTGTQLSFDRLVRAVDEWADETKPSCGIFGQVLPATHDPYTPRNFETKARLSPADYAEVFSKASLIISHAGMGTILTALTQDKQICIMPRQIKYGEHRNNHQLATVERLKEHPRLFKARDEHDLPRCLDAAMQAVGTSQTAAIDPFAATDFTDKLRKFVLNTGK